MGEYFMLANLDKKEFFDLSSLRDSDSSRWKPSDFEIPLPPSETVG